ncbi:retrotransposon gag domain-containing protein, partial [Escherichia coli]|uniref:retrotransposon gag domain-containing protein n=1 Tax=Escherichia coli TaxID=562 RepID=UPI001BFC8ED8
YDRLLTLTGEISELGKELTTKEINLKVLRGLPSAWEMKVVAVQASKDVKTYPTDKLISDLKAHEFEMI